MGINTRRGCQNTPQHLMRLCQILPLLNQRHPTLNDLVLRLLDFEKFFRDERIFTPIHTLNKTYIGTRSGQKVVVRKIKKPQA